MTQSTNTKRALACSAIALILCFAMLIGTTFAWFTDSATSGSNIIKTGNLLVGMYWAEGDEPVPTDAEGWTDAEAGPIFNNERWEPGYAEAKHIKLVNEGSLSLKFRLSIVPNGDYTDLADVIDVYYIEGATQVTREMLEAATPVGTLRDMIEDPDGAVHGFILPEDETTEETESVKTATIALRMRHDLGNDYQGLSIGTTFSVQLLATQYTAEEDSFGNDYDADARYVTSAATLDAFFTALENGDDILLTEQLAINGEFVKYMNERYPAATFALGDATEEIDCDAVIDGGGITVYRTEEMANKPLFSVATGYTLVLSNITLDGGAKWTGEVDPVLLRGTVNEGIQTTKPLIQTEGTANIVLDEGTLLQNNGGASAVNLATRGGGSLTLNGAEILNNIGDGGGAIWGGDDITINEGSRICGNASTSIGGAIRMVDGKGAIIFTMNGGELSNNKAVNTGGAIWGGNNATYYFNGGVASGNASNEGGGFMWTGISETIYVAGTEIINNYSKDFGGAFRLSNYTTLTMTDGAILGNTMKDGETNAFYDYANGESLLGGRIDDFIHTSLRGLTIGEAEFVGVATLDPQTNHDTVYLAERFNTLRFIVDETHTSFDLFNFEPAASYIYTEGDEAKLICMNEGYETYWDAEYKTISGRYGAFRIREVAAN